MTTDSNGVSKNKNLPDKKRLATSLVQVVKNSWLIALIALVGAVGLIILFALLTDAVFDKELTNPDQAFALWTYSLASPVLTGFLTIVTDIGSPLGTGILTAIAFGLLVWRKFYSLAWLVVIIVGGSAILDEVLKLIFRRTRPDLLLGGQHLSSYSFPSGHATGAICFFGFLIWLSWNHLKSPLLKWLAITGSIIMILLVGFSRIYLGVHYPTDVIGGYFSGGSWLIIFLSGYYFFQKSRKIQ